MNNVDLTESEIITLGARLLRVLPSRLGEFLITPDEALRLAQYCMREDINPFAGEVYLWRASSRVTMRGPCDE